MTGVTDLAVLLRSLKPVLSPETFVFCSVSFEAAEHFQKLQPLATFREQEGMTFILARHQAEAEKLSYQGQFAMISLSVHSSLSAVGLTAAVSQALADKSISANIVAAYFHDHIFVPTARAQEAMETLHMLADKAMIQPVQKQSVLI